MTRLGSKAPSIQCIIGQSNSSGSRVMIKSASSKLSHSLRALKLKALKPLSLIDECHSTSCLARVESVSWLRPYPTLGLTTDCPGIATTYALTTSTNVMIKVSLYLDCSCLRC